MHDTQTIWTEYQLALKAYLSRRIANRDDVEELLQEIMLKTHQHLPTLRQDDTLRAWLFRIARNVTVDYYRKSGRKSEVNPDDLWYSDEPYDGTHALEGCVEPFLNGLPSEDAELLRAVELNGVSQKDYAAELNLSYSTLKSRVQMARKKLHKRFTDCCNFEFGAVGGIVEYETKTGGCKKC